MLIDTNASLGPWPFSPVPDRTGPQLVAHLHENGIDRALVSHLGTVFLPDPMPANRKLFATVRRTPELLPVPTINPALAHWREQLSDCLAAGPVRAVKIYPNYHNYTLRHRNLAPFVEAVAAAGVRLIINARLEDERHKYFALRIKGVPVKELEAFLVKFSAHTFFLSGAYKPELEKLSATVSNFTAEIAFCEWMNTLEILTQKIPAQRLALGTCSPLMSTRAQVDKLRLAKLPAQALKAIGSENAVKFFGL